MEKYLDMKSAPQSTVEGRERGGLALKFGSLNPGITQTVENLIKIIAIIAILLLSASP